MRAVAGIQTIILVITMVFRRTPVRVTPNPWYWSTTRLCCEQPSIFASDQCVVTSQQRRAGSARRGDPDDRRDQMRNKDQPLTHAEHHDWERSHSQDCDFIGNFGRVSIRMDR